MFIQIEFLYTPILSIAEKQESRTTIWTCFSLQVQSFITADYTLNIVVPYIPMVTKAPYTIGHWILMTKVWFCHNIHRAVCLQIDFCYNLSECDQFLCFESLKIYIQHEANFNLISKRLLLDSFLFHCVVHPI